MFDRNNINSICTKQLYAHLVFSAASGKELDSTKVIQLVLLGLFWNWAMGQWAPFWQPFATPALAIMLFLAPISTQIMPKCAEEALNKTGEVLPGFSGFTIPVLHVRSWKPDEHPSGLDWESKTLLKA